MTNQILHLFVSKPIYLNGQWTAWTSSVPFSSEEYFEVNIKIPESILSEYKGELEIEDNF